MSNTKFAGMVTPAQAEVLKTLYELNKQMGDEHYWRPKDLGAYRSSHHSITLRRLVEKGLVERTRREGESLFSYKISKEGMEIWEQFMACAAISPLAVSNQGNVRGRLAAMKQLLTSYNFLS